MPSPYQTGARPNRCTPARELKDAKCTEELADTGGLSVVRMAKQGGVIWNRTAQTVQELYGAACLVSGIAAAGGTTEVVVS
ncbi:MAG: hypothetical protein AB7P03_00640 [Kofleriaceae bacterium]